MNQTQKNKIARAEIAASQDAQDIKEWALTTASVIETGLERMQLEYIRLGGTQSFMLGGAHDAKRCMGFCRRVAAGINRNEKAARKLAEERNAREQQNG